MHEAIFISIRRPSPAEGGRRGQLKAFALRAPAGRPITFTVAPSRRIGTAQPFAEAFRSLGFNMGKR